MSILLPPGGSQVDVPSWSSNEAHLYTNLKQHLQKQCPSRYAQSPAGRAGSRSLDRLPPRQWWHWCPILYDRPPEPPSVTKSRYHSWQCVCQVIVNAGGFFPTYHDSHIPHALEGVVHASVCHVHQHLLYGLVVIFRVDHVCGSKLLRYVKLAGVEVNSYNPGCTSCFTAHDCCEAQRSETEHSAGRTSLHLHNYEGQ